MNFESKIYSCFNKFDIEVEFYDYICLNACFAELLKNMNF